jgi:hypothetical protein
MKWWLWNFFAEEHSVDWKSEDNWISGTIGRLWQIGQWLGTVSDSHAQSPETMP